MSKTARMKMGIVLAVLLALAGPAFAEQAGAGNGQAKYFWKMANPSPRGIGHAIAFEKILVPAIGRATNNELGYKMYWGGVMGNDDDMIKKMRVGQLHACGLTGIGTVQVCPEMIVMSLPFLFKGYDEVDHIKKTMFATFDKSAADHGFKLLFIIDQGFDMIYSTMPQITTLEDLRKTRFLSWSGPLEMFWMRSLGIAPISVKPQEMPSALRQGVYNTLQMAAIWVVATQTFSVLHYVNPLQIRYAPASPVCPVSVWEKLPAQYRKRLMDERVEMERQYAAITRHEDEKGVEALIKYGLAVRESPATAVEEMKRLTRATWDEMAGKYYTRQTLDEITSLLARYRQSKPKSHQK